MTPLLVVTLAVVVAWPARPPGTARRPPAAGVPSVRAPLDRRLVAAVGAVAVAVVVSPLPALLLVTVVGLRPRWVARRDAARRRQALVDALPEAADLLAVAVAGGLAVRPALVTVARWAPPAVAEVVDRVLREVGLGRPLADALEDLGHRLGAVGRPLVDALLASERYGVALGDSLDRVAREARLDRRRRAEARARRVPVLLLFPLVLCVLPAFALLTVVPLLVGSLPELPP